MQNETASTSTASLLAQADAAFADAGQTAPIAATVETAPAPVAKPKRAKQPKPATANVKQAAKRVAAKQAATKPAKPTQAAREQAQRDQADAHRLARSLASAAVGAFYSGTSKPFKAASDRFADLNPANGKTATARQAALALALIVYGAGNMQADGTFTRGAFRVPAKLLNPNAKPGETALAQPESGCIGNMLGRSVDYVSGPRAGREQAQSVFKLRVNVALAEIQATFGDKQAAAAKRLLAGYAKRAA